MPCLNQGLTKASTFLCAFLAISACHAQDLINRENQLKAVYLMHFAELTRWPSHQQSNPEFTLCLLGHPPVLKFLKELSQKTIGTRRLTLASQQSISSTSSCQIIYFYNNQDLSQKFLSQFSETLLVGNHQEFITKGGHISFQVIDNKIKLLINLPKIRNANMDISSKLLRIANVIE